MKFTCTKTLKDNTHGTYRYACIHKCELIEFLKNTFSNISGSILYISEGNMKILISKVLELTSRTSIFGHFWINNNDPLCLALHRRDPIFFCATTNMNTMGYSFFLIYVKPNRHNFVGNDITEYFSGSPL